MYVKRERIVKEWTLYPLRKYMPEWLEYKCEEKNIDLSFFEWDFYIMWLGIKAAVPILFPYRDMKEYFFEKPWTWRKVFCRLANHPHGGTIPYNSLDPEGYCHYCEDLIYLG